jgi:glycosyltransferase involved in cell wall biosynthesis
MRRQRVFFFNRFFWPDESATAQILTDLCDDLGRREDLRIIVVTSRLGYGDSRISFPAREQRGGVEVIRLWSTRFGRGSLFGRLLDYLTIYISFLVFILREIGPEDLAVFKTDPPLLSVLGAFGRQLKGFQMISWCQDVFPEVAMATLSFPKPLKPLLGGLVGIRNWSLRQSEVSVVLGRDMAQFLRRAGLPKRQLRQIPNWSVQDDESSAGGEALRKEWGIEEGTFVVGYSGNLGRAHDWKTVLDAACQLRDEPHLLFLVCGGGHGFDCLQAAVSDEGLGDAFRFLPYQPREALASSLRVPDLHWFTLKESLTPFILPSKFVGILQAGRPLAFVGQPDSEVGELIQQHGIGGVFREGDHDGLAKMICEVKQDQERLQKAGKDARLLWESEFKKEAGITRWVDALQALAGGKAS